MPAHEEIKKNIQLEKIINVLSEEEKVADLSIENDKPEEKRESDISKAKSDLEESVDEVQQV
jgi:hypothetical protein